MKVFHFILRFGVVCLFYSIFFSTAEYDAGLISGFRMLLQIVVACGSAYFLAEYDDFLEREEKRYNKKLLKK